MKRIITIFLILFFIGGINAQELKIKGRQGGLFSLGVRTSMSVFEHNNLGVNSFGFGGQFRLQLTNRLNTEWFADYARGNIDHLANRTDYHIGWSMMYYFTDKLAPPVKPYILVGHCFDRTELVDNSDRNNSILKNSSAIQAGAGVHFNLTDRMDITFTANYMFHLGKDVHGHIEDENVHFHFEKGTALEGHLLLNLSFNYKIVDLWARGKKNK